MKTHGLVKTMNLILMLITLIISFSVTAQQVPYRFNFSARILKPDGQPLQNSAVAFRFTLTDANYVPPAAPCVMYVEEYSNVDMTGSFGYINISIGSGYTKLSGIWKII